MPPKTTEEKIDEMYEAMIRLEPFCEDVRRIKKWVEGNGMPGAKFQLWVLWGLLLGAVGYVTR